MENSQNEELVLKPSLEVEKELRRETNAVAINRMQSQISNTKEKFYTDITPKISGNTLVGYERVYDVEAVKNSIRNLFLCNKGSVPGKPFLGNPLNLELFELFDDTTAKNLETAITNEIEKFEPRVEVESVEIIQSLEMNRIIVTVYFSVYVAGVYINDILYLPFTHNTKSIVLGRTLQSV